jgi:UTP--glucose-1-phosphate uridylyltransferase
MIQWAVEEAALCGIRDICIVIREGKEMIRRYFDAFRGKVDAQQSPSMRALSGCRLDYVYQKQPLGLGNAIYEASAFLENSGFVMIVPDQFLCSPRSATEQLLEAVSRDEGAVWSSVVTVGREDKRLFPGARAFDLVEGNGGLWKVSGIRERVCRQEGSALLAFGRSFFPKGVMPYFGREYLNEKTGEVDLLPTFKGLMRDFRNYAIVLKGRAMDLGTWDGYERFYGTYGQ